MYELIQITENSYYMDCPAKVGICKTGENEVVCIDSGSDKDAAKKIKRILDEKGWTLKTVYNTHSHADHTGGNQYLQTQTGCRIYAPGADCAIAQHPELEPVTLYGGFAMKELHNKFLMAKESNVEPLNENVIPDGWEIIKLPGHSYDMVGFKTADNVVYLADCLSSESTLEKYQIGFLYDVKSYMETLEMVKQMQAECFVPAHAQPGKSMTELAQKNIDKTLEVTEKILSLLDKPKSFDELLADVFTSYELEMNLTQRMLVGSTVKSYLAYLKNEGRADCIFVNNTMLWTLPKEA